MSIPPAWHNYYEAGSAGLSPGWQRSAIVSGVVVAGQTVSSVVGGLTFAKLEFRGRRALLALCLAAFLVPAQVTWLPSFALLHRMGLIDTLAGLALPFLVGPLSILVMILQFNSIPRELEEAAIVRVAGPVASYVMSCFRPWPRHSASLRASPSCSLGGSDLAAADHAGRDCTHVAGRDCVLQRCGCLPDAIFDGGRNAGHPPGLLRPSRRSSSVTGPPLATPSEPDGEVSHLT